ncbi:MAG: phosphatidylglycerophosphatase A [Deltaproteobacteria bacterium]|nr:phosphatidylglycerophosphatase A [Deltaproteobacteria bacterium]
MKTKTARLIVTVGGLGELRFFPGTWGSLVGLLLAAFFHLLLKAMWGGVTSSFLVSATLLGVALAVFAHISIRGIETSWPHDDGRIVIDEVVGQFLTSVWFAPVWGNLLLGFVLFRTFDIIKPWPIRVVDRRWHHPFATLFDDILAGGAAAFVLWIFEK